MQNKTLTEILNEISYEMEVVFSLVSNPYKYNFGTIELDENGDVIFLLSAKKIKDIRFISSGELFSVREIDLISDKPLSECSDVDWHKFRSDLDILQQQYKDYLKGRNY